MPEGRLQRRIDSQIRNNEMIFLKEKNSKSMPCNPFIEAKDFSPFTYSKRFHFNLFSDYNYDIELFKKTLNPDQCSLKNYQDLLVFSFIKQFVPEGSRLLDVGGGNSRIIKHFKKKYQCWNVDKLEGRGNGPKRIFKWGFRLVKDYIGNFNPALPDNYFDFVFSISALEHVPGQDPILFKNILDDLNRVLKPGGYSLHCFDSILKPGSMWVNRFLIYIFEKEQTLNRFFPFEMLDQAPDLFVMSEQVYNRKWKHITRKTYDEFGKPFSYNILWQKPG
ncbi:MAG: class I SAM-dependent methyltransferase [Candidatus Aminicenantes bacterium]|nr:MAG: class I SAM-dependent methyltransferase [Candidatus Aminicenantes bacterium]